jgi:uncharacterized membrane protein
MKKNEVTNNSQFQLAMITLVLVNVLFFIDEGFYNFYWMLNWGNWLAFILYFTVLYSIQVALLVLANKFLLTDNILPVSFIGIAIGLICLFTLII